jgi:hypothetical protein
MEDYKYKPRDPLIGAVAKAGVRGKRRRSEEDPAAELEARRPEQGRCVTVQRQREGEGARGEAERREEESTKREEGRSV